MKQNATGAALAAAVAGMVVAGATVSKHVAQSSASPALAEHKCHSGDKCSSGDGCPAKEGKDKKKPKAPEYA